MICFKWMLQGGYDATFRNLTKALNRVAINADILKSVNKSEHRESCLPSIMQDKQLENGHLKKISSMIAEKHVHLGVELKVPLSRIEQILTEDRDVHIQCLEIMKQWRRRKVLRATFRNLEKACICVGINPDILNQSLK
ncbi:hypothetical protein ACJMK2_009582 [Sinanodonta woodiana]|uniref:Death domain-containing protein n=1 Tax=Sinanodonta woodiana TaxID=1069815 RepID=A0ABD3VFN7_SINWO